jgi:hypothetical protein
MRHCIFCDGNAETSEHAWPVWLIEALGGTVTKAEAWLGPGAEPKEWAGAPVKVRCVCFQCNNGWMSNLESRVRPLIGAMMQDFTLRLDRTQQHLVAAWCVKTAMVFELTNPLKVNFYTQAERELLRSRLTIPDGTLMWLGRQYQSDFTYCHGRKLWTRPNEGRVLSEGFVTTLAAARLVLQAITVRLATERPPISRVQLHETRPGPWGGARGLVPIWPTTASILWPPAWSFREPDLEPFSQRFGAPSAI